MDKRRAVAGETIIVSGAVERRGSGGWTAAPKGRFDLWIQNGDGTGCTDGGNMIDVADDGTFRVAMTAQRTGHFKMSVSGQEFFVGTVARTGVVQVRPAA